MKPLFTFFIICLTLFGKLSAQNFQFGFNVGTSVYLGDLDTPSLADKTEDLNLAYGFFFRHSINNHFNIRLNFMRGELSAADSLSSLDWQIARNLSFRTEYAELGAFIEFDLFDTDSDEATKWWTPFITAGVGYFHYNPQTILRGEVIDLQPIGTEGQGLSGFPAKYSTDIMSVPIGGGIKVRLTRAISIQLQAMNRFTFTDFIDDVSSRFYPAYEDLVQAGASPLQQLLYSRAWEVSGDVGPDVIAPNTRKASPDVNDYVLTSTFSMFINISDLKGDSGEGCPSAF